MNILVCMKQVPDDSVEIHLNADGAPDLANVTPVVNAFDTYALEMAARLKESSEGEILKELPCSWSRSRIFSK